MSRVLVDCECGATIPEDYMADHHCAAVERAAVLRAAELAVCDAALVYQDLKQRTEVASYSWGEWVAASNRLEVTCAALRALKGGER